MPQSHCRAEEQIAGDDPKVYAKARAVVIERLKLAMQRKLIAPTIGGVDDVVMAKQKRVEQFPGRCEVKHGCWKFAAATSAPGIEIRPHTKLRPDALSASDDIRSNYRAELLQTRRIDKTVEPPFEVQFDLPEM
jgi:hypothetical protein